MATKSIAWNTGSGNITVDYGGSKDGTIVITSDNNNLYESRSQQIKVKTTDGSNIERTITIQQAAKVRIDISSATVTAANQTYSGSAKTPTPTVTLNGETIPSSGYDVAYSNNTNAGTATITVTGKGDYTGTATGTFTIAKANPTYTAPTARTNLTYSGSSQYLVTAGSTSHGTIQYSSNGTTWSTTRPSSTNAGSYTTYWRLVGDSNHNDVASTSLSTTIAKASRTLSFADAYVVLDTSSNVTKTATPSAGSGDGTITYSISSTTYATINSSSGKVTSKTSDGSAVVTATIAEGTNYLSATASYNLYVFATTHSFSYTGSVQSLSLPPGSYKLQCWGAQGGSISGSYSATGSKGGYSEGVLTLSSSRTVYAFVGGQGSGTTTSASAGVQNGGWNCGGGAQKKSSYNSGGISGGTNAACGGGATDICLTTSSMSYSSYRNNRSNASLLSRMIVAGGGAGAAVTQITTTSTQDVTVSGTLHSGQFINASGGVSTSSAMKYIEYSVDPSKTYKAKGYGLPSSGFTGIWFISYYNGSTYLSHEQYCDAGPYDQTSYYTLTIPSNATKVCINSCSYAGYANMTLVYEETTSTTTVQQSTGISYGGGTNGGAGLSSSKAGQSASSVLDFGKGKSNASTGSLNGSGGGGGGWYGGGANNDTGTYDSTNYSGGGSGWVNTAASSGNRPSGYTGLQLDSGETKAGNVSFPAPGGGNETGHSGNGYAKITRLA